MLPIAIGHVVCCYIIWGYNTTIVFILLFNTEDGVDKVLPLDKKDVHVCIMDIHYSLFTHTFSHRYGHAWVPTLDFGFRMLMFMRMSHLRVIRITISFHVSYIHDTIYKHAQCICIMCTCVKGSKISLVRFKENTFSIQNFLPVTYCFLFIFCVRKNYMVFPPIKLTIVLRFTQW